MSSERADGLVGEASGRLFALTATEPRRRAASAWEERVAAPWHAAAWSAFLRAANGEPGNAEQAIAIAWLVYRSLAPGQGLIEDEPARLTILEGQASTFSRRLAQARALGHRVRSEARRVGDGYEVTLWTSRLVWTPELRVTSAGHVADEDLRRVQIRLDSQHGVTLRSEIAAGAGPPTP